MDSMERVMEADGGILESRILESVCDGLTQAVALQDWEEVVRSAQEILQQSAEPEEGQVSRRRSAPGPVLTEWQSQTVLDGLLLALEWGDFQVRWSVSKLLPLLGGRAIAPLLDWLQDEEADGDVQWFVVRMLGSWTGAAGLDQLMVVLQSGTPELQSMALSVLIQQGNAILDRLKPLLIQPETRRVAVQILAGIRTRETLDLLLTVVSDENPTIRQVALEALSSFQDPRLGLIFNTAIADPVATVRATAAMSLAFCQTVSVADRVQQLVPLLWDVHISVCCSAANSLGRLDHPDTIVALGKALEQNPLPLNLGIELVRSLFHLGNVAAITTLTNYLKKFIVLTSTPKTPSGLLSEVLRMIGRIDTENTKPIVLDALIECLKQPDLTHYDRTLVITALSQLKSPQAITPLIEQLIHPHSALRLHILHALQQIDPTLAYHQLQTQQSQDLDPIDLQDGIHFILTEWR
jgi:HEAT repeat protein